MPEEFVSVRDYLREKHLNAAGDRLDNGKARALINDKSRQYYESATEKKDDRTNWIEAAGYVETFYNHIIPAVMQSDKQSQDYVGDAIRRSQGRRSRLSIMNAFEAAICLYFLKGFEYHTNNRNTAEASVRAGR